MVRMEDEKPVARVNFKVGQKVRILGGPFNDFHGSVSHIDTDKSKVRVIVDIFGRGTPVELDFTEVEKA
jgi:transcriptional antiterminator NusG